MGLFKKNKKLEVIKMDDNGKVIDPNAKKEKRKDLVKKVAIGLLGLAGGVVAFVGVGVAMAFVDEKSSGSGTITFTPNEDQSNESETESTGTSEE